MLENNKTTLSPGGIKLQEEIAKNRKSPEKAKATTETAKEKYLDAQGALKETKPEDAKAVEAAKKSVEDAKSAQKGSYVPKESERNIYHVKLDKPAFDPKSGKKLSKEYIQKFTTAEWNQFEKNSAGLGYTMEIMWNPEALKL